LRSTRIATLILFAALALQWRAALVTLGGSLEGDQTKHFTSGVMVYDYLRTSLGSNPVRFVESFEVQYPLIAIGHWPPMYYAVQALFYFVAGPFILSAQILSALTAAGIALLVFLSLKRHVGSGIACIAAACFLAAPLVQTAAWQVMSDLLTGFFVYLALLAFARLLDWSSDWKAAVGFAIWAVAAILTKGSAWALGPFFFLTPLIARRSYFFRSRWFLVALSIVILFGSAFYFVAARTGIGYPTRLSHYLTEGLGNRLALLKLMAGFAPALLIATAALGAVDALHARWRRGDQSKGTTLTLVAAAWVASQFLFLTVLPMTFEPRVLLPAMAPMAVLAARFFCALQYRIETAWQRKPLLGVAAPLILGAMIVATAGAIPSQRATGYRETADAMAYPSNGALILVATNYEAGEEQIVTERLSHSRIHKDVILRGSHVLSEIDAAGNDTPRFQSADALRAYLLQMPVRYIVLSSPPYSFSYQTLVNTAVSGDPADFHLLAQVPILRQPDGRIGELRIYENPAGRDRHPSVVTTPMGYDAGRRMLEYHWK
jgi:hypothetical protein